MEVLISEACRRPMDEVRSLHYDLVGPEGELILPSTWDLTIQAGWTISIHFVQQALITPSDNHSTHQNDRVQRLEDQLLQQEARNSRWEQERLQQQRQWESERANERLRWEADRQNERDRWEGERQRERDRWETDRHREREELAEQQRQLVERFALAHSAHRAKAGSSQRDLCSISPCICWLSGKSGVCNLR